MIKDGVEFDQICLILKHFVLEEQKCNSEDVNSDKNRNSFLNHFLIHDNHVYVNQMIQRFNGSSDSPNVQWMITEIIKYVVRDFIFSILYFISY